MSSDGLEPGWLDRELNQVVREVDEWPEWLRREAGITKEKNHVSAEPFEARMAHLTGIVGAQLRQLTGQSVRVWAACNQDDTAIFATLDDGPVGRHLIPRAWIEDAYHLDGLAASVTSWLLRQLRPENEP